MAIARLTDAECEAALARLPQWRLESGGAAILRDLHFADFAQAFGYMARVAIIAERLDHHPEWSNVWNRVAIRLTTHDAGGLSARDIALAEAMEAAL